MKTKFLSIIIIALFSLNTIKAQTLKVDPVKSKLHWKGTKKVGEHSGVIAIKQGSIVMKDGKIVGGKFIIDMKAITILDTEDADDRKDIIKDISSKQFFNVAKYPTATFEIKGFFDNMLLGILTIKGISKRVTFKASYEMIGGKLEANSVTFSIVRQDWNLKFGNWFKENVLDDPLQFKVHIEAK